MNNIKIDKEIDIFVSFGKQLFNNNKVDRDWKN